MHLLAATPGQVSDGTEPVDPDQSPADLIVLSAADSELAVLSEARERLGPAAPSLRLANLSWLQHPFAVDLYLDKTAVRSRMVLLRLLGGRSYWSYGLEQFATRLRLAGVPFAALPGDDKPDPDLAAVSTLPAELAETFWGYLVEGGPENAANFLRLAAHLLRTDCQPRPPGPRPLLKAGLYWPGKGAADRAALAADWVQGAPVVAIVFYRALLQGAGLDPVNRLVEALAGEGLNPLPLYVASLKDPVSAATLAQIFAETPPDLVLNTTSFAVSTPGARAAATPLDAPGRPVLQLVLSAETEQSWSAGLRGLGPRDIAMNVALPEIDGRILARAVGFKAEAFRDAATECPIAVHRAQGDRVSFSAKLAAAWVRLARATPAERRVGLVLANYPNKDGRLANGVGLDTPASAIEILRAMAAAGYRIEGAPADSATLMRRLTAGPTNWLADRAERAGGVRMSLKTYRQHYEALPGPVRRDIEGRWGPPEDDPFLGEDGFALSILAQGNVVIGIQPARGYNIDPEETYHAPDLAPPHNYLAFYLWLREVWGAHALIHLGKHGNLEWLPGKAVALSQACFPEAVLGPIPNLYPFIVNDPGEGTQAKRRSAAVILDHLTPPMTRAGTYGDLEELEGLVDELYEALGVDARRSEHLRAEILERLASGIGADAGLDAVPDPDLRLAKLDAWLCEIKEAQIRDGLHVFGRAPVGPQARDLTVALARLPRGAGHGAEGSLHRALAQDLALDFDPLDCDMAAPWTGPRPEALTGPGKWRSVGDTLERIEGLAARLVEGGGPGPGPASAAVLGAVRDRIAPAIAACGPAEIATLLAGLDGRFVVPGPSGAPTRGRLDVLPTGRNFYSVDTRAVPTRTAWELGWRSACALIERHLEDEGDWPRTLVLSAWGTANMRTGGDDIAQALALMGVRPVWDAGGRRVTGFEILPLDSLGRPRIDVTLRISGFFRDAFPAQVDLVASAARAVMELDEPAGQNPAAARFRAERERLGADRAARRVFGAKPGAYGAGLQAMIDERLWRSRGDLAEAYLAWGGYAYGAGEDGTPARSDLETRLAQVEAVLHNQDNREHDLLDSDDYYQFEGGLAVTVEALSGAAPKVYHNDHSRPERPVIRTLQEEIARVVRARVVNPKWIDGCKRHGYKGAFEMAATVDYLFAFAATTQAVRGHHFDLVHEAYLADEDTCAFLAEANPAALREIAQRLQEAIDRGLWQPRSNAARGVLERLSL